MSSTISLIPHKKIPNTERILWWGSVCRFLDTYQREGIVLYISDDTPSIFCTLATLFLVGGLCEQNVYDWNNSFTLLQRFVVWNTIGILRNFVSAIILILLKYFGTQEFFQI